MCNNIYGKPAGKLFFEVDIDTDKLAAKCKVISEHLSALANNLERIDSQADSNAKACKVIDLLNELNDKDLKEIADYARALVEHQ